MNRPFFVFFSHNISNIEKNYYIVIVWQILDNL